MIPVKTLLESKPHDLWTIGPQASVYEALELLSAKDVGAVIVVDGERVVGLFSERDYARKVILKGKSSKGTKVEELMSRDVLYVRPEQTVNDCMALMSAKRVRHLPVMEKGKLLGIVTIGDVVKAIIDQQGVIISGLENYITGSF
jgi:CBS domain-containing protein